MSSKGQVVGGAAINAAKSHCKRGHLLAGDNLVQASLKRGQRVCRTCQHATAARRYAMNQRAAAVTGLTITEYLDMYGHAASTAALIVGGGAEGL